MPAMAPRARSASASGWTARSSSSHRRVRPFGVKGGEAGQLGKTIVRRLYGAVEELKPSDQTLLEAGEAVTVITPTAGGYGKAKG